MNPFVDGRKVVVRLVGNGFEYWNSCGWTPYRRSAVRYCLSEAVGVRDRINRSKDFPFKVAAIDERPCDRGVEDPEGE